MPKKPHLDVNFKRVRAEIQRTGGNQSDVDRPSTATGKKAERIAAKLQNVNDQLPRNKSSHEKVKGTGHGAKRRSAA